ncbi:cytochrome b5 reductase-like protein, partial [Aureobasidium melanogenum]
MSEQQYTIAEVQKHNEGQDLWIVVHNKVYDVGGYLHDHPGGGEILKEVAGGDATSGFEDAGHSDDARETLEKFSIGSIAKEDETEKVEVYRPVFQTVSQISSVALDANESHKITPLSVILGISATALGGFALSTSKPEMVQRVVHSLSYIGPRHLGNIEGSAFWAGIALATSANILIAAGALVWAVNHLDVHREFTSIPSHRPVRNDIRVQRKIAQAKAQRKALDPQRWRQFALTKKTKVSSNVYRLTFALDKSTDILGLPIGQHIAIRAIIDGKDVQRSYTPVSNDKDLGRIELCIKVYPGGLITNYLANLELGDKVDMRGPKGAMKYSSSLTKHIGMIAGGTGITPMYQVIRAICEDTLDKTTVSLLYANNTEEDILMREELESFAKRLPKKFKMHHVLGKPSQDWNDLTGFVSKDYIQDYLPGPNEDTTIMMCGPPGMIEAEKKNLIDLGYDKPRAMSRMGDQVFLF